MGHIKAPHAKTTSKGNKKSAVNVNSLQAEVASFASSLGLAAASTAAESGFNDADFRKSGPIRPKKRAKDFPKNVREKITDPKRGTNAANSGKVKPSGRRDNAKGKWIQEAKNKRNGLPSLMEKISDAQINGAAKSITKVPLMKPSSLSNPWYADAAALEGQTCPSSELDGAGKLAANISKSSWEALVQKKTKQAQQLMDQYVSEYEQSIEKRGDMRLVTMSRKSGTTADKVAAITVLVQDNPLANLKALDTLLAMVTSKVGKRHAAVGIDALKELFLISLLPDRKLKYLVQQSLHALPESRDGSSLLLFWYWEDCLKHRFERFVIALEDASKDTLPFLKDKAVKTMFELLKNKPEQERKLLSALVNKLGDPERKVASNAGYHLSCLLTAHPNMKAVVIEEVDIFVFRPRVGQRARYHAAVFLNQILLSSRGDGPKLAKRLVDIYFALFTVLISEDNEGEKIEKNGKGSRNKLKDISEKSKKKDSLAAAPVEIDSRLLSALLTGVNRAFPYVSTDEADNTIREQGPVLFQLVHSKSFNIGVQALMLLYQLLTKNQTISDRFYRALYSTLLTPALMKSSKTEMFLGLMFKALKTDTNSTRAAAFSKRLMQVALQQPPQFACACLLLLSEVLKARPALWNAVLQPEDDDEDIEHFVDVVEEGDNVTKNSPNGATQGFARSDSEFNNNVEDENDEGVYYSDDTENSVHTVDSGDDNSTDEEDIFGAAKNGDIRFNVSREVSECLETKSHTNNESETPGKKNSWPRAGCYDPWKREPTYCNADRVCWWELTTLASHVHPSVATMAQTLLCGSNIVYNGDPLRDLSLGAFLDRFIEKKPKSNKKSDGIWHGGSQIGPARKIEIYSHPIGPDFLHLEEGEVPPEDVVFHRFYLAKSSSSKRKTKKKKAKKTDEEVTGDDLFVGDDGEDDFAGGDESDNEEIDNLIEQNAGLHTQSVSDGEYDYDKLDEVFELDDKILVSDESEGEGDILVDAMGDDAANIDEEWDADPEVEITAGKTKRRKRKLSETSEPSPFASLEDYSHLLNDNQLVNETSGARHKQRSNKKSRKKGHSNV